MTKEQTQSEIDRVDNQLSPENLYCDGEISHTQAQKKYNALMKERRKLVESIHLMDG